MTLLDELWCGVATEHTKHRWVGHHGRDFWCPGADGVEHPARWNGALLIGFDTALPEHTIYVIDRSVPLAEAGEPENAGGYARMHVGSGGWERVWDDEPGRTEVVLWPPSGLFGDERGVAGEAQPADAEGRGRLSRVAGAPASDVSLITEWRRHRVVRLVEFLAACSAVGGVGWRAYMGYLRYRKKYRGRR